MPDSLTVIIGITNEHEAIRAYIKSVRNSNEEVSNAIQLSRNSGWTKETTDILMEKLWHLEQSVIDLSEGYKNHYVHEEEALFPIVGDTIIEALRIEHNEILRKLDKVKSRLSYINLQSVKSQSLFVNKEVNAVFQLMEDHREKEEGILQLLKKLFEAKAHSL